MARESLKALGPVKLSWSAILAGSFFALGVLVLFGWLGLAIGLTVVDGSARASGIWLAIWIFVAPILAMFLGGMVSGRFSGVTNRAGGAMHGAILWGFASMVIALLGWGMLTTTVGGLASVGGAAVQATGAVAAGVGQIPPAQAMEALGIDAQDLMAPLNQDRQARGLPPLPVENVEAAVQDAVGRSLQQGRVDREILISSLVDHTEISRAHAEQLATDIEGRLMQAGQGLGSMAQSALNAATSSVWFAFLSGLLSLGAAAGGGSLAVSRSQREPLVVTHDPVMPPPVVPGGGAEVYP